MGAHPLPRSGGILHAGVDLAAAGVRIVRGDQRRGGPLGLEQSAQHVQGREHAGIGEIEVAEVVVGGMLTAEDGVVLGHELFDPRMADGAAHRLAAGLAHRLGDVAGGDQVRDHRGTLLPCRPGACDLPLRDERGDRRGRHGDPALVEDHAPIRVSVEGEAQVCALAHHGLLQVAQVLRAQRIGRVVGEAAVEGEVQVDQLELCAPPEHGRCGVPGHAVARIDHHPHRAPLGQRHEIAQRRGVVLQGVDPLAASLAARRDLAGVEVGLGRCPDLLEPRVASQRAGSRQAELEPVVLAGVVGGGDHDACGVVQARGAVELIGGGQPRIGDDRSAAHRPLDHRAGELRGAQPHVMGDDQRRGVELIGEGGADSPGDLDRELLPCAAAHVIGQEEAREVVGSGAGRGLRRARVSHGCS